MKLHKVLGSSIHLSSEPVTYVPKVENFSVPQYEPQTAPHFNLEDLYIVQLAKNIINFKKAKFNEIKEFLEQKAQRWETIILNEKSKLDDYLRNNNEIFDIGGAQKFKEDKLEDLIELIKLKKLKVEELVALNKLVELKQTKLQEVKNIINLKKSKVEELLANTITQPYQENSILPNINNIFKPQQKPSSFSYQPRTPTKSRPIR